MMIEGLEEGSEMYVSECRRFREACWRALWFQDGKSQLKAARVTDVSDTCHNRAADLALEWWNQRWLSDRLLS